MQMNRKYLSVIILTAVFAVSLVICIIISNIKFDVSQTDDNNSPNTSNRTSQTIGTEIIEVGGSTNVVAAVTTKAGETVTNNILDGIMDDIYDNKRPVIINPSYGNNVNNGSGGYEVDGQTETTVYDTVESTKNGETTKPEPEETTKVAIPSQNSDTETKKSETSATTEETTGIDNAVAAASPVDNSEGSMTNEGEYL